MELNTGILFVDLPLNLFLFTEAEVLFKEQTLFRGADFCLPWTISDLSLTFPEYS